MSAPTSTKVAPQPSKEDNESQQLDAWLRARTPDELESLRDYAWDRLLSNRKVNVNGKQVSLKTLAEEVSRENEAFERGLLGEDQRSISRFEAQQQVPSRYLRRGSFKQILRKEEEEALELRRMGQGTNFSKQKPFGIIPFLPTRNFSYGIFARPERVEEVFGEKWAGQSPERALMDESFYLDIIGHCHQIELTAMMFVTRPLPLFQVRKELQNAMQQSMEELKGAKEMTSEESMSLENFIRLLDDKRLATTEWVEEGKIKKGTHIIVSTTPRGWLAVEAITPGTIGQRRTSYLGVCQSPLVTAAAFNLFLGAKSFDRTGKRDVGSGILWAANGLKFDVDDSDASKEVAAADKYGRMQLPRGSQEEHLPFTISIFQMSHQKENPAPMLLDRISSWDKHAFS